MKDDIVTGKKITKLKRCYFFPKG